MKHKRVGNTCFNSSGLRIFDEDGSEESPKLDSDAVFIFFSFDLNLKIRRLQRGRFVVVFHALVVLLQRLEGDVERRPVHVAAGKE